MRPQLNGLRDALLNLHKVLVDSERASYEQTMGTIHSPNQLLQLLINDPWFAWLHPLSRHRAVSLRLPVISARL